MAVSRSPVVSSLGKLARFLRLMEISQPSETSGRCAGRSSDMKRYTDDLAKGDLSAVSAEMLLHVSLRANDASKGADPEQGIAAVGDILGFVGSKLLSRALRSMTKLQSC